MILAPAPAFAASLSPLSLDDEKGGEARCKTKPLDFAIAGASGRMGQSVSNVIRRAGHHSFAAFDNETMWLSEAENNLLNKRPAAVIDFSSAVIFDDLCALCIRWGLPLVSGTTGLSDKQKKNIDHVAQHIPVLWEPNMSLGVLILAGLVREASRQIALLKAKTKSIWDVEIEETHHRNKIDSPSGTALRLAESVRLGEELSLSTSPMDLSPEGLRLKHGREGLVGPRSASEIGIHALRGGDVIGDHSVHFFGLGERLELSHYATHRDLFAEGALIAALFLATSEKKCGRYTLLDAISP